MDYVFCSKQDSVQRSDGTPRDRRSQYAFLVVFTLKKMSGGDMCIKLLALRLSNLQRNTLSYFPQLYDFIMKFP